MADKQLVIVVEGTSGMASCWNTIVSDYLYPIIRSFCGDDMLDKKPSSSAPSGSTFELALVMFNAHVPYSAFLVQRSGWTRDVNSFFNRLSTLSFSGGGSNDVATAEGLAEALMMLTIPQNGYQAQQNLDGTRHCVLVSASNPYTLPTPVYPAMEIFEPTENGEAQTENILHDAEAVSKWFGKYSVSLSVISSQQLPKLRAIYNAAKRSHKTPEPAVDVKQPDFLVLLSCDFKEACAALNQSGMPPANESTLHRPPISTGFVALSTVKVEPGMGSVALATVKMEPGTETAIGFGHANPRMPYVAPSSNNSVPEFNSTEQGIQSVGTNNSGSNIPMSQQGSAKSYIKFWQGDLFGKRQGQPVHITKLEGYRNVASSETLAVNWPSTMQIERLISKDHIIHMQNKQYVGKLVYRALTMHGFLSKLQEKKLCAVIQLPSQVLLLLASDKACRLIAMLLPRDMCVFKPLKPSQEQLQCQQLRQQLDRMSLQQNLQQQLVEMYQQRQRMQQWEPQAQQQILQLQQPPPPPPLQLQPQQMVGGGMGQGYSYTISPSVPQSSLQGQVSYQGILTDMAGNEFMGSFEHQ